jgi:hypothetical protein
MRKMQTFAIAIAMLGVVGSASAVRADAVFVEVGREREPVAVERYPHTWHHGHRVYYYDGHWYYRRAPHRWVYYREEPRVLYEYRTRPRAHDRVIVERR